MHLLPVAGAFSSARWLVEIKRDSWQTADVRCTLVEPVGRIERNNMAGGVEALGRA